MGMDQVFGIHSKLVLHKRRTWKIKFAHTWVHVRNQYKNLHNIGYQYQILLTQGYKYMLLEHEKLI
jgi:hypothetical protein